MTNEEKIKKAIDHLLFARERTFPHIDGNPKMQVIFANISLALYDLYSLDEKENENVQCSYCS